MEIESRTNIRKQSQESEKDHRVSVFKGVGLFVHLYETKTMHN